MLYGFLLLCPLAAILTYVFGRRHGKKAVTELFPSAHAALHADIQEQLTHATAQWSDWERKAGEYHHVIAGILKEKQVWIDLYNDSVIAHGNAQTAMMDTIGHLHTQLTRAGVVVPLPPMIDEARELFLERHVNPVVLKTGTPVIQRGIDTLSKTRPVVTTPDADPLTTPSTEI